MVATLGEGAYNRAGYLAGNYCQGDGWRPALEVVRTALAGEMPSWLDETYGDEDGDLDLELLWSHIKAEADTSPVMRDLMRSAFGGLCRSDALWNNAIRIPWRDGGCVPMAPPGLEAVAAVDGVMAVSWQSPDDDGGSRITGYTVQWKSGAQEYDTSREASVTDLADLSHTIEGLSHGVDYTIRILPYNINGDGDASEVTETAVGSEAALGTLTLAGATLYPHLQQHHQLVCRSDGPRRHADHHRRHGGRNQRQRRLPGRRRQHPHGRQRGRRLPGQPVRGRQRPSRSG